MTQQIHQMHVDTVVSLKLQLYTNTGRTLLSCFEPH